MLALDDALVSWLTAKAGSGLVRWLRGDRARVALQTVVDEAVAATVTEVAGHLDGEQAEHLRSSLQSHDLGLDVGTFQVMDDVELQVALRAWTAALDRPEFGEPGYLSGLGLDAGRLADTLSWRIADGIRSNGRQGGPLNPLAEWLWRDELDGNVREIRRTLTQLRSAVESATPRGGGLPGGTSEFTGRREALDELAERVEAHDPTGAVVAIHAIDGMAGVGKTELALRAAHECKHRYPDGQYFINLHGYTPSIAPMSPEAALDELLRQAGVAGREIPSDLARRQARWQSLMANQRTLVLLDNALDADQVRPLLPRSPSCLVLITSRARLGRVQGVRALHLDVLGVDEAIELFSSIAGADRSQDSAAVARVVELVGRLPVAVRAVGSQIDEDYTVAELADDLTSASVRIGVVDQTSGLAGGVRAALETSMDRLDRPHRRALQVLGAHPGPTIGVPQFAALVGLPVVEARRVLRMLADRNLITAARGRIGHPRYELHDLLREFVRRQADAHLTVQERSTAIARLTAWYATAIAAAERFWEPTGSQLSSEPGVVGLSITGPGDAHAWLAAEQANLVAFAGVATGPDAARACHQAAWLLYLLDYYATARTLFHSAVDLTRQAGDRQTEAAALVGLGQSAVNAADYPGADGFLTDALAIYRQLGERKGEADALTSLGHLKVSTGDYSAGTASFRDALAIYRQLGERRGEAGALNGLARAAQATGGHQTASRYGHNALNVCRQIGYQSGEAEALFGLALAAMTTDDYAAADQHFRDSLAIYREIEHRAGEADARIGMGEAAVAARDPSGTGIIYLRDALTICRQIGHRLGEADALTALGEAAKVAEQPDDARELWQEALATYADIGSPLTERVQQRLDQLDRD